MSIDGALGTPSGLRQAGASRTTEDPVVRPVLSPGVVVLDPQGEGAPWIIRDGPDRYFRVSADLATLARSLDGQTPIRQLAEQLGGAWSSAHVEQAWERLVACELVGDREPREGDSGGRRFKYVPPLTFQLNVVDPAAVLRPFNGLISVVMGARGFLAQVLFAVAGIIALALRPAEVWAAATTPLSLVSYGAVAIGFVLATAIHEFGHGAVLTRYGGRPSRMGVMLFYLAPAFFCDVSDGWRLPHPRQRVQVACSGITTQAVLGAAAAFASLVPALSGIRNELILFAAGAYLGGILNLVPFVKFDGYLALMAHVDVPNLRDKAMGDARAFLARFLFGVRVESQLPQFRWAVAFGLACIAFPIVLVSQAVNLWATALAQVGFLGLLGMIIGLLGGAAFLGRGWLRLLALGRDNGASSARMATATVAVIAALGAFLCLVQIPRTVQGGYFRDASGATHFILPGVSPSSELAVGDRVTLFRSGVLGRQAIGEAAVSDATITPQRGPISAVAPVTTTLTTRYAATLGLTPVAGVAADGPAPANGIAVWTGPSVPVWRYVVDTYVRPLF